MPCVMGLDLGAFYSKGVLLNEDGARDMVIANVGRSYADSAARLQAELLGRHAAWGRPTAVYATGSGSFPMADKRVTETSCLARAVWTAGYAPCTVIDLGGQSGRILRVDEQGRAASFFASEQCAGGGAHMLESIAGVLGLRIDALSDVASGCDRPVRFTTGCAVFIESEAITAVAGGETSASIIAGCYNVIAGKLATMIGRGGAPETRIVAVGGGAMGRGLIEAVAAQTQREIAVMEAPAFSAALGAALLAADDGFAKK